jgi:AraC-like DNA-binding protein
MFMQYGNARPLNVALYAWHRLPHLLPATSMVTCIKPFLMKLKKEDIERIRLAKDLLQKSRRYHITINDLSRETQLNRTKLQYGFKELFGVSIDDYRIKLRMEKARELLEQTEKSVKEISVLVGYKSMGSFSAMFKKVYRMSPSEWRNERQNYHAQ